MVGPTTDYSASTRSEVRSDVVSLRDPIRATVYHRVHLPELRLLFGIDALRHDALAPPPTAGTDDDRVPR